MLATLTSINAIDETHMLIIGYPVCSSSQARYRDTCNFPARAALFMGDLTAFTHKEFYVFIEAVIGDCLLIPSDLYLSF
jgi:hypothetical protein